MDSDNVNNVNDERTNTGDGNKKAAHGETGASSYVKQGLTLM